MELRVSRLDDGAQLALASFVAARHPAESCGHNGLPLTPNSVAILGQAQAVKRLKHDNLCLLLDCIRGKHERVVLVSECYDKTWTEAIADSVDDGNAVMNICRQLLEAMCFLHDQGLVVAALEPSNIMFNKSGRLKLFNYGLGHMTDYGSYVAFPIFNPRFAAPEVIAQGRPDPASERFLISPQSELEPNSPNGAADSLNHIPDASKPRYDCNIDTWSLGMIVACWSLGLSSPWANLKVAQVVRKVLSLRDVEESVLERLARDHDVQAKLPQIAPEVRNLIDLCLVPRPEKRPSAKDLLDRLFLGTLSAAGRLVDSFPSQTLNTTDLSMTALKEEFERIQANPDEEPLEVLTVEETYYLWKLAGGDILGELRKHGLMATRPRILSMPKLVLGEGHSEGELKERCTLRDPVIIRLSLKQLRSCLQDLTSEDCHPLVLQEDFSPAEGDDDDDPSHVAATNLPLIIRECDVRYQFSRVVLYRRLLQCYPFHRPQIWKEARTDSLPLYRAYIWAALLGIEHDTVAHYEAIDKESWTPTDRQIEVDIPRCHQYNSLLASPEGHRKFKRILKAWVVSNPHYVYWQGLDSLCAPFLFLNFNDEALAFACLHAFIPKYLNGMFQKDNAAVIQEYLAKFSHVQAFHDAELFNHLDGIGFIPDLYAIPWILTMFAHVFPLHNILHLWDKLLLGNSAFPLCIGLAILQQLRERLLASEFNDCILLFSDMPAIDIDKCVQDSIKIFCTTPRSLTYRRFGEAHPDPAQERPENPDLGMSSITLQQQKAEKVPRLSGEELLELLGPRSHSAADDNKMRVLVVDVRTPEEFRVGALSSSVNLSPSVVSATAESGANGRMQLDPTGEKVLSQRKGKIVCVVGSKNNNDALQMAAGLLACGISRLCVLHVGIEIFRSMPGVLCVPNT